MPHAPQITLLRCSMGSPKAEVVYPPSGGGVKLLRPSRRKQFHFTPRDWTREPRPPASLALQNGEVDHPTAVAGLHGSVALPTPFHRTELPRRGTSVWCHRSPPARSPRCRRQELTSETLSLSCVCRCLSMKVRQLT